MEKDILDRKPRRVDTDLYSKELANFVSCCLTKGERSRYSAKDLLSHPFLKSGSSPFRQPDFGLGDGTTERDFKDVLLLLKDYSFRFSPLNESQSYFAQEKICIRNLRILSGLSSRDIRSGLNETWPVLSSIPNVKV